MSGIASRLSELRSCVVSVLCSVISARVSKLRPTKLPVFFPAGWVLWACSTPFTGRPRIALPRGLAHYCKTIKTYPQHSILAYPSSFIKLTIPTYFTNYYNFTTFTRAIAISTTFSHLNIHTFLTRPPTMTRLDTDTDTYPHDARATPFLLSTNYTIITATATATASSSTAYPGALTDSHYSGHSIHNIRRSFSVFTQ